MQRLKTFLVGLLLFRSQLLVAPLLVFSARSWKGWLEGVVGMLLTAGLGSGLTVGGYYLLGFPVPWEAAILGGVCFVAAVLVAAIVAPHIRKLHAGTGAVGSHFLRPRVGDITGMGGTEDEYVWLLVRLVTTLDPRIGRANAVATRRAFDELLRDIARDRDYDGMARATDCHNEWLLAGRPDPHHCFTYCPPDAPAPHGLLVFLHGHGTNWVVAWHALRPVADACGLVLVAPTFGYGNWEAAGGVEAIDRAERFARERFAADPDRVYLAGLSQGGAGVGRAAAALADRFAGLIFLSPTMESDVLSGPAFAGRRAFVAYGGRDRNVTPASVEAGLDALRAGGASVADWLAPDADHFLYFAEREEVCRRLAEWIGGPGGSAANRAVVTSSPSPPP